ncbi:hypothetical protein [Nocardia sp. NPDC020380]|uniref:hypothetical protein n=1 Tax=Nocardia sp. NPDC020380 TaxID=3364309 RepID=UPI003799537D
MALIREAPTTTRSPWPALGLFLLAPFIGEFLLGNITIDHLALGLLLAPLYGGGAVLVREIGRRSGGWPTMLLLAAAYALIEEGPVDQLLWNPSYAGHDLLHTPSFVPFLGTNIALVQSVLALHTVWSICVPIAIMETFAGSRRNTPWLGPIGLTVTAVVYVLGAALVCWGNYTDGHFMATPVQFLEAGIAIIALIVLAFAVRSIRLPAVAGRAPGPVPVGVAALVATSAYWGPSVLVTASWYEWVGVAAWFVIAAAATIFVSRWSRQQGWGQRQRFALAAGATLTYIWAAFPLQPEDGGDPGIDLLGNVVFGALGVTILVLAARRVDSLSP